MKSKLIKLPKTLGECADRLGRIRDELKPRLESELAALETERKAIEARLILELPASKADGIAGKVCRVTVVPKRVPQINDWSKLTKFIKRTGAFELLQHRLSNAAVEELWEAKKPVPGVEGFTVKKISLTKK